MKRQKRRYLLLRIDSDSKPSQQDLIEAIWGSITKLYGECGASATNLSVINYNEENKRALIRVSLNALQSIRASLALITRIGDKDAAIHLISVSGTMKSLEKTS